MVRFGPVIKNSYTKFADKIEYELEYRAHLDKKAELRRKAEETIDTPDTRSRYEKERGGPVSDEWWKRVVTNTTEKLVAAWEDRLER